MKKILATILTLIMVLSLIPMSAMAITDTDNGDWSSKAVVLKNTSEAELMVRVGDIDALNYEHSEDDGYNPFTASNQYSHNYPWPKDPEDAMGTDSIYVGSNWKNETCDGYSTLYSNRLVGGNVDNAYSSGSLVIKMEYNLDKITVKNALLQLCIDDFQALNWGSHFTVTINGVDAPFVSEIINHVDQTGPTSYIISAIIPSSYLSEIATGVLEIEIDETTGCGDGFAVDFAKLLINYKKEMFSCTFEGETEPSATVRLLGTSTTVKASASGKFTFEAIPGLNAVRASKDGYVEAYDFGVVAKEYDYPEDIWVAHVSMIEGQGTPDIDFSQFGETAAWENASAWAREELAEADKYGLIPDSLRDADLTKPITRAEFAAISVRVYEALSDEKVSPVSVNPFTDTKDTEVLKAYAVGITTGTSDTTFHPDNLLTREQAATMLTRVYKKVSIDGWEMDKDADFSNTFESMFTMPAPFADDANISNWAKASVYFMVANGIINGVGDNKFAPKATTEAEVAIGYAQATREQALAIAIRMVKNLG